jgi:Cu/Ag efflux pump CusA
VIGGLVVSTFLTLLIVPAMYVAFGFGKAKKVRKVNKVEVL